MIFIGISYNQGLRNQNKSVQIEPDSTKVDVDDFLSKMQDYKGVKNSLLQLNTVREHFEINKSKRCQSGTLR